MGEIKFGTSGWRGILAEDFTLANIRLVIRAIGEFLQAQGTAGQGVIIGYDPRFLGENFARAAVEVLAPLGIKSLLCQTDTPTPVVSYEIVRRKAAGGINFTASHNPPEYNGVKFSPADGGPALPETTQAIEQNVRRLSSAAPLMPLAYAEAERRGLVEAIDPRSCYFQQLSSLLDAQLLKERKPKVAFDVLYGTARHYLEGLTEHFGVQIEALHNWRDPYFGGRPPEPAEEHLSELIRLTSERRDILLGCATDGDADRFGIVDKDGTFIQPNYIIALLLDYLITDRGFSGGVARSVATSHLVDRVAKKHSLPVYETPVGFKYIGEHLTHGRIAIGGEESAGLTIKGHVPEKDGILACLLMTEMVTRRGQSIRELLASLYQEVGTVVTRRLNIRLTPELKRLVPQKMERLPANLAGLSVLEVVRVDGVKMLLEGKAWVLFRASGTEPVVRLYAEAGSEKELDLLMQAGRDFLLKS